jgi:hypothetical protein
MMESNAFAASCDWRKKCNRSLKKWRAQITKIINKVEKWTMKIKRGQRGVIYVSPMCFNLLYE